MGGEGSQPEKQFSECERGSTEDAGSEDFAATILIITRCFPTRLPTNVNERLDGEEFEGIVCNRGIREGKSIERSNVAERNCVKV